MGKKKKDQLRRLTRDPPSFDALNEAHNEIHLGSDRAAAILVAAALEPYLECLILGHLPNLDEGTSAALTREGGALATFSNKIYLAYAMGLIDEITRDDLNIIRDIRNTFAHAMGHVSFANPEIQQECNKLKTDAVYKKPYLGSDQSAPPERQRYLAVGKHIEHKLIRKGYKTLHKATEESD